MEPDIAELVAALPAEIEEPAGSSAQQSLQQLLRDLSGKAPPTGRWSRLWTLGTMQGKIAAAYGVWWARAFYENAEEKQKSLNETHLKAALKLLGGMGYLRGAIMKLGQVLANYPNVVPDEFVDVLGRLHFEAPPMHFSMLREFMRDELGGDPTELFDDFETEAFAAASLGQVHRARLKGSGHPVAIKVQYPNIGKTIRSDFRNLNATIFPMRISPDWDNIKAQLDEVRIMLEMETDYEQEAEHQRVARLAFREDDEIVVPRVYPDHSTRRVLTMDYIDGKHLGPFLAGCPTQSLRDRHGHQIALAVFRLSYGAREAYADPHPGNFLFMPDGRLGLIDFGCCRHYTDDDVDYLAQVERAMQSSPEARREAIIRAADLTPAQQSDDERIRYTERWCDWTWEPLLHEGPFNFGNSDYFKRGVELFGELVRRRYVRSLPLNTWLNKSFLGVRAMLANLNSRVDMRSIFRQETTVR